MGHGAEHRHERSGAVGGPTGAGRHRAPAPPTARRRPRRLTVGLAAVGLTAGLAGVPALALNTNPPAGPGNIEIFPIRDMVAIDGYLDYVGQEATFTVVRDGQTIGRATGTVGPNGFYEINHPGGSCWDDVTPDIQAGDDVFVEFPDGNGDGATTLSPEITRMEPAGTNQVVVEGTYGSDAAFPSDDLSDPGRLVVEIVNPDMRDTPIGERAIGWPFDPADPPTTYQVARTAHSAPAGGTLGTFEVTYTFQTEAQRDVAAEGAATAVSWQADSANPDIEAQFGATLSEFGESGGPGMGGCPAGPSALPPRAPADVTAQGAGDGQIQVDFGPGSVVTQSPAITGYRVRAVLGEDETGKRLGADARSTTLDRLAPGELYAVEVTAVSAAGESRPTVVHARAADHTGASALAVTDSVPTASGAYEAVLVDDPATGDADEGVAFDITSLTPATSYVHYTLDGTPATTDSPVWRPSSDSLSLRATTTVSWLAVDGGRVAGASGSTEFIIEAAGAPSAPGAITATAGDRSATLTWPADTSETAPTSYDVRVYTVADDGTATLSRTISPAAPETGDGTETLVVDGLAAGTTYRFGVVGENGSGVSPETLSDTVTPVEDARADAGPDQTVRRGTAATLDGSASVGAESFLWAQTGTTAEPGGTDAPVSFTSGPAAATATFVFPTVTFPQVVTDHELTFELTTTTADGATLTDDVVVTAQPDIIALTQNRGRNGDIRLGGTGTVPGARITISDESNTAAFATATVDAAGQWTIARVRNVNLTDADVFVHSDRGFAAEMAVTR